MNFIVNTQDNTQHKNIFGNRMKKSLINVSLFYLDQTCRSGEFTCSNGRCIMEKWRCDRDDDCGDGSDEIHCTKNQCDPIKQFQCADNTCVPAKWRCDGELDCNDGSDERVSSLPTVLLVAYYNRIFMLST
jgi:hypothetical protein